MRVAVVHDDATVYGKVLNGGPHPVTVIAARSRPDKKAQVFRTLTSDAGAFSLTVPPGPYVITSPPCGRAVIHLRVGTRTKHNFNCAAG